jgi:hypothetical protein
MMHRFQPELLLYRLRAATSIFNGPLSRVIGQDTVEFQPPQPSMRDVGQS